MADTWVRYNLSGTYWEYSTDLGATWFPLQENSLHGFADFINGSAPSNPASGRSRLYTKSDNRFYSRSNGGVEVGPFPAIEATRIVWTGAGIGNNNIPNTTWTLIKYDAERFDTDNMVALGTDNTKIVINTAGKYLVGFQGNFAANAGGTLRAAVITLNGAVGVGTIIGANFLGPLGAGNNVLLNVVTLYDLAVNDFLQASAFQDSGGTLAISISANFSPEFWAHRLS